MKNKGFTLIELLAVIVILAIIALIATPIILGIINDAKKQSGDRSAELYLDAAKKAIASYQASHPDADFSSVTTCDIKNDGKLDCNGIDDDIPVEMSGQKPNNGGKVLLSNGNVTKVENLNLGGKYYNTDSNKKLVASDTPVESQKFTGNIYRNSTEAISVGDSIVPETRSKWCGIVMDGETVIGTSCSLASLGWDSNPECVAGMAELGISNATCEEESVTTGLTSYETEETKNNITKDYYFKHTVEDDIITGSYICLRYTDSTSNEEVEACIKGGDDEAYSSNSSIIASTEDYFVSLGATDPCKGNMGGDYNCDFDNKFIFGQKQGIVRVIDGDSYECTIQPEPITISMCAND